MTIFGMTDRGRVRPDNQDTFRIADCSGYVAVAVCDGMGGAKAGALASSLAADSFMSHLERCMQEKEPPEAGVALREAASFANIRVFDKSRESLAFEGMGTTLVAALVKDGRVTLINVGDSRCYHFSRRGLRRLTVDHSLVEEMVSRGEITRREAENHPRKNVITQAVGLEYRLHGDIYYPETEPGETLLFCSDGLSNVLGRSVMEEVLYTENDTERCCARLMELALAAGAPDNVTVVLLRL